MKIFGVMILLGLTILLGAQIFSFLGDRGEALRRIGDLNAKLEEARASQEQLEDDFGYFSNPLNLEKELKARFNYREAGEKLIIIVPQKQLSSPPSGNQ